MAEYTGSVHEYSGRWTVHLPARLPKATNHLQIKINDCSRILLSYVTDQHKIGGAREGIWIGPKHVFMRGDVLIIQLGININTCIIMESH